MVVFDSTKVKYAVYQLELGSTGGLLHVQGYLVLKRSRRMVWVKAMLGEVFQAADKAHLEPARGNHAQARDYCRKLDGRLGGPWEPLGPGEDCGSGVRTDLNSVREKLDSGVSLSTIAKEDFGAWCRYRSAFQEYQAMKRAERDVVQYSINDFNKEALDWSETFAWLIVGPTNMGKTGYAMANFKKPLLVSDVETLKALDPKVHDGIVFDDMSFNHWPAQAIIHLLDGDYDREIRCRYFNAVIPKGFRRIFTHNSDTCLMPKEAQEGQTSAILRRYKTMYVEADLRSLK